MDYTKHQYIIAAVAALKTAGSWTGKTHVQKTLALTSLLGEDALPFEFVLYKHGPFSFDVDHELDQMQSYNAIDVISVAQYGTTIKIEKGSSFPKEYGDADPIILARIQAVANFNGSRGVVDLEALATSTWIRKKEGIGSDAAVLARLKDLKPHLAEGVADRGVKDSLKFLQTFQG